MFVDEAVSRQAPVVGGTNLTISARTGDLGFDHLGDLTAHNGDLFRWFVPDAHPDQAEMLARFLLVAGKPGGPFIEVIGDWRRSLSVMEIRFDAAWHDVEPDWNDAQSITARKFLLLFSGFSGYGYFFADDDMRSRLTATRKSVDDGEAENLTLSKFESARDVIRQA